MKYYCNNLLFILMGCFFLGCSPDFLEKKPNKALVVPNELEHYQAILDAFIDGMNSGPGLQLLAGDEFYHLDENLDHLSANQRNTYMWNEDIFDGQSSRDWNEAYRRIFYANIALDGLSKLSKAIQESDAWRQAYGHALFLRANSIFGLSQLFTAPYHEDSAGNLPGLPLRSTPDVNVLVGRSTLKETFQQVEGDLLMAVSLLSTDLSYESRPSKQAAWALLARVYLVMHRFDRALEMATNSLDLYDSLLDFNTLDPSAARPFPPALTKQNPEIIYYSALVPFTFSNSQATGVDTILYDTYHEDDLRKTCYFIARNGMHGFKGSFQGGSTDFGGLTTGELHLVQAECHARLGNHAAALNSLNTLLRYRFTTGKFQEYPADTKDLLALVLLERRKELFSRGLRWSDLRRLNQEPELAIDLKRIIKGQEYVLRAGSNRYVFPIPDDEIMNSGISQNPR